MKRTPQSRSHRGSRSQTAAEQAPGPGLRGACPGLPLQPARGLPPLAMPQPRGRLAAEGLQPKRGPPRRPHYRRRQTRRRSSPRNRTRIRCERESGEATRLAAERALRSPSAHGRVPRASAGNALPLPGGREAPCSSGRRRRPAQQRAVPAQQQRLTCRTWRPFESGRRQLVPSAAVSGRAFAGPALLAAAERPWRARSSASGFALARQSRPSASPV